MTLPRPLTVVVLITLLLMMTAGGCARLEPRWLLRALPGEYPDVTYFVPTQEKLLAITLDDGPDPAVTGELLDLLAAHDARATFFFVTDNFEGNEHLVRRAVEEGHELGNHLTFDEVSARLPPEEFSRKLDEAATRLAPYTDQVHWFRPGSAWYNDSMLVALEPYHYRIALASMPPLDARIPWPGFVSAYIRATVKPGSIIVLHTRRHRGARTLRTLERVMPALERRGYRFVTLSELDAAAPKPVD